jgi:hypothetical protein
MDTRKNASMRRTQKSLTWIVLTLILALTGCPGGSSSSSGPSPNATLNSITVSPASPSVGVAAVQKFKATGTYSDGSTQDVTSSASWTSSDTSNVTIQTTGQTNPGVATAVAQGSATITAQLGGLSGTATLTVTIKGGSSPTAPLASISVNPPTSSVIIGATQQFKATGTYTDGTTQDITSSVNWTSVDPSTATFQTSSGAVSGLATAIVAGSVTIGANLNGISGLATLVVTDASGLFSATPLMDMPQADGSCLTYKSFPGGLYENCSDNVPTDHDMDGRNFAALVKPLDTTGNPSASGQAVLLSMGMGAAADEFAGFVTAAKNGTAVNQTTLQIINGAETNMDACDWIPAVGPPTCDPNVVNNYDRIDAMLANQGLSPLQVQVVWIKNANGRTHTQARGCPPLGTLCVPLCDETITGCSNSAETTDALNLEQELGDMVRAAYQRYPNLKLAFITSRIYAGYSPAGSGNPEPFAYEYGFSVKWLVQAQINQARGLGIDPVAGDLGQGVVPWIGWGPYFWADGPVPRSDGLAWCDGSRSPNPPCNGEVDFEPNGEDPVIVTKQDIMLMNFFLTSPYTTGWFPAK